MNFDDFRRENSKYNNSISSMHKTYDKSLIFGTKIRIPNFVIFLTNDKIGNLNLSNSVFFPHFLVQISQDLIFQNS